MHTREWLYYQVGNFRTPNKLSAVEKANGDISKVKFCVFEKDLRPHDWTKEPLESINDLIDRRVRELRDQYSYVCLWYSGGYDSEAIMQSFLRTGTRIDEILIYGRPWIDDPNDIEDKLALEYAVKIKEHLQPWINIRYLQYDPSTSYQFYKEHGTDWIYYDHGNFSGFTKQARANTARYQKEFRDAVNMPGRIDINGVDKPKLDLRDGKWWVSLADKSLHYYMDTQYDLFFMTPEATEIYIKQVWMAIDWFERQPECCHEWVHQIQSNHGNLKYREWNLGFGRPMVHNHIADIGYYKKYFNFGVDSIESRTLRSYSKNAEAEVYNIWQKGVEYLSTKHSGIWTKESGFPVVMSEPIYIKDYEAKSTI